MARKHEIFEYIRKYLNNLLFEQINTNNLSETPINI